MLTWTFYFIGQLLHVLLRANAAVFSPGSTMTSNLQYLNKFKVIIAARLFASTMIFMIVIDGGPSLFGDAFLPDFTKVTILVRAAMAGLIGLAADSVLDKVMLRWTWLQGQIPEAK